VIIHAGEFLLRVPVAPFDHAGDDIVTGFVPERDQVFDFFDIVTFTARAVFCFGGVVSFGGFGRFGLLLQM